MTYVNEVDFREPVRRKLEFFGLHNETYLDVICDGMFAKIFKDALGSYSIPSDDIVLSKLDGDCAFKYEFKTIYSEDENSNVIEILSNDDGGVALRADLGNTHFYAIAKNNTLTFGTLKDDQFVESVVNLSGNDVKSIEVTRNNLDNQVVQNATVKPMGIKLKANEYYSYTPKKHGDKPETVGRFINKFDRSSRLMAVTTSRELKENAPFIPNIIESTVQEMDKDLALEEVKKRRLHK